MNQKIKLVMATFGCIDVVVTPNHWSPNTYVIGNKNIDFSHMLPSDISLETREFYITIFDGIKPQFEISVIIDDKPVVFKGSACLETPCKSTILPYE